LLKVKTANIGVLKGGWELKNLGLAIFSSVDNVRLKGNDRRSLLMLDSLGFLLVERKVGKLRPLAKLWSCHNMKDLLKSLAVKGPYIVCCRESL